MTSGLLSIISTLVTIEFRTTRWKCSESITGKSGYRFGIQTSQHHRGPLLLAEHHHRPLLAVLLVTNFGPSKNLSSWLSVGCLDDDVAACLSFAILAMFYHHPNNLSLGSLVSPQACTSSYQDRRAAQCKFRVS
ncbi:hypothetical protein M9H77_02125 [Catharanthus roseus]|uniref:Uncharacterized protein n=1 Tax=Catharanthus roseus TaxID=4058 RepID=A0ACC0C7X6_CATRO|nr:hypothetical protein M9H77_02125 [Catharanthus roseus]